MRTEDDGRGVTCARSSPHESSTRVGTPSGPCPTPFKARRSRLAVMATLALAAVILFEILRVTLGSNFHTVLDQRLYRAAQPSGATLENYIHTYDLRTVINLRGPNHGEDWFDEEEAAARRRGVNFISINIS